MLKLGGRNWPFSPSSMYFFISSNIFNKLTRARLFAFLQTCDTQLTVAYLRFEITGANLKFSPVFLIDRFLYTVSYKPILSAIDLIS